MNYTGSHATVFSRPTSACHRGIKTGKQTRGEIAETFGVHLSTLEKWTRPWRETRTCAALAQRHGPRRALRDCATFLRTEIKCQPDVTLPELCARVTEVKGVPPSPTMMCREPRYVRCCEKKSMHDRPRDTRRVKGLRRVFRKHIVPAAQTLANHLKFIDESGVNLGLTRLFGRATPGQQVLEASQGSSGPYNTVVAAVGLDGVQASRLLEGAMSTVSFETYAKQILASTLRVGDWVVPDNLSVHKGSPVRSAIEARGAQIIFLPTYSPDLDPIERCWAKVKIAVRAAKARTWDTLVDALASALRAISPDDIQAWFTICGYASP